MLNNLWPPQYLINFSSKPVWLSHNDNIAKIVFYKLDKEPEHVNEARISISDYEKERSHDAKLYHKSFLDITSIENNAVKKATSSVNKSIAWGGVIILFLLTWATLEPILSKWIYDKTGLMSNSQQIEHFKEMYLLGRRMDDLETQQERLLRAISNDDAENADHASD